MGGKKYNFPPKKLQPFKLLAISKLCLKGVKWKQLYRRKDLISLPLPCTEFSSSTNEKFASREHKQHRAQILFLVYITQVYVWTVHLYKGISAKLLRSFLLEYRAAKCGSRGFFKNLH